MANKRRAIILALLSLTFAAGAFALALPPKPTAWVTDNAALFSSEQQLALNQKCETFFHASKAELAVMTFPSLEGEDPLDFTNRAVNQWKVNGDRIAVLFVFVKERQMRIQVGYGLEGDLTDAYTTDVRLNTLVPAFRAGRYYEGINEAVDRLAKKIDPNWTPPAAVNGTGTAPAGTSPRAPLRDRSNDVSFGAGDVIKLLVLLLIIFFFVLPILRRGGRGGGCIGCFPFFPFGGGGWGGGGTTFGGGGGGGGGWSIGSTFGGGGGSSFGGGGSGGGW